MKDRSTYTQLVWLAVCLITVFGAHLRMQSVLKTVVVPGIRADALDYVRYAENINRFGVFSRSQAHAAAPRPDAVRSPGYPAVLSVVFDMLDDDYHKRGTLLLQAVLSTITIILSFILLRTLVPPGLAAAASALVAISPHLVMMNVYFLSETLYAFAVVLCFWCVARYGRSQTPVNAGITGVAFGLSALIRPALTYFPWLLALVLWRQHPARRGLVCAAALIGGFLATQVPWTVRNIAVTGAASDDTLKISFIQHGMYPGFMYRDSRRSYAAPYRHDPDSSSVSRSIASILSEVGRRFREEPVRHLRWYLLEKPLAFWSWHMVQGTGDIYIYRVRGSPYSTDPLFAATHSLSRSLHWPLVIGAILGCLVCWLPRRWLPHLSDSGIVVARAISALLAYYTLIHIIGAPFPRYSVPLRPLVYGMAMFAGHWIWLLLARWYRLNLERRLTPTPP